MFAERVQPQCIPILVALMLGSTLLIERSVVLEIQQNLDNCIGESGKTKHLIEAR